MSEIEVVSVIKVEVDNRTFEIERHEDGMVVFKARVLDELAAVTVLTPDKACVLAIALVGTEQLTSSLVGDRDGVIARAWAALKVDPKEAADDPDTADLADSIKVSLQHERDDRDRMREQYEEKLARICEIADARKGLVDVMKQEEIDRAVDFTTSELVFLRERVATSPALQLLMRDCMVHTDCFGLEPDARCTERSYPQRPASACELARRVIGLPAGQLVHLKEE